MLKNSKEVGKILNQHGNNFLEILKSLNAVYECPKDHEGNRLGPLVAYKGSYSSGMFSNKKYVGDTFINFKIIELYPNVMHHFAQRIEDKVIVDDLIEKAHIICGHITECASLPFLLAFMRIKRVAYFKEHPATWWRKKQLAIDPKSIRPGENIILIKNVWNNFSETQLMIDLIEEAGGKVIAMGGILNRSMHIRKSFNDKKGEDIPVCTLVNQKIQEWEQDEPEVVEDISKGNIVMNPPEQWGKLIEIMQTANGKSMHPIY